MVHILVHIEGIPQVGRQVDKVMGHKLVEHKLMDILVDMQVVHKHIQQVEQHIQLGYNQVESKFFLIHI